jgi:hypothetical protein
VRRAVALDELGTLRIGRRKWMLTRGWLRAHGLRGQCGTPRKRGLQPFIVVSSHIPKRGMIFTEVVAHEVLHAALPELSEQKVRTTAHAIALALKRYSK